MFSRCGCFFGLLSFVLTTYLAYSSVDVTGLAPLKCRIAGVLLVENVDQSKKFNYTMAENVCESLGLELASRAQVEKAWRYGFETCSYGWVTDKYGVISRIQHNEKCGKNQTGVLTWSIQLSDYFKAYCFNVSDAQINSCKPELMVTRPPSTVEALSQSTLVVTTHNSTKGAQTLQTTPTARPDLLSTQHHMTSRPLLSTLKAWQTTTPQGTTQREATTTDTADNLEDLVSPNQLPHKKEKAVFGGLPTTLLILALMFFIAAVVLAVCYVKKYKTNLLFTKKKEEKDNIEAKMFKENRTAEGEENKENGKQAATTGNSLEAEV